MTVTEFVCAAFTHARTTRTITAARQALRIAITHGWKFQRDEFASLKDLKASLGLRGDEIEHWYRLAVIENRSAAIAIERHLKRPAFIAEKASIWHSSWDGSSRSMTRQTDRLALGSQFIWEEQRFTVTKFAVGNNKWELWACAYKSYGERRTKLLADMLVNEKVARWSEEKLEREAMKKVVDRRVCFLAAPFRERTKE